MKEKPEGSASLVNRIYSVATVGGEMEAILDLDATAFTNHYVPAALSPDGKALVTFTEGKSGIVSVSISDPWVRPCALTVQRRLQAKQITASIFSFRRTGKISW